jgi:hypothetical protein
VALVLFDESLPSAQHAELDYDIFTTVRRALSVSIQELGASPSSVSRDMFLSHFRPPLERGLPRMFQRAVLEWRPFNIVFVAKVKIVEGDRCRKRQASIRVEAKRYDLGDPPLWAIGRHATVMYWPEAYYLADLDARGLISETDAERLQAAVAVQIVQWLAAWQQANPADNPPPLSGRALNSAVDNVIAAVARRELWQVDCAGDGREAPACLDVKRATLEEKRRFLASLVASAAITRALPKLFSHVAEEETSCGLEVERNLVMAARGG